MVWLPVFGIFFKQSSLKIASADLGKKSFATPSLGFKPTSVLHLENSQLKFWTFTIEILNLHYDFDLEHNNMTLTLNTAL